MFNEKNKILLITLRNTAFILFVLIFIIFGLLSSEFLEFKSLINIVKQSSYIGIVAVGMTFVLLTAGIDLSVGSNMYLSAAVAGILFQQYELPGWIIILCALMIGFTFGVLNSFLIIKLKIIPFVATLGTMQAGRGVARLITKSESVFFPESITNIGKLSLTIPVNIIILSIIIVTFFILFRHTSFAKQFLSRLISSRNLQKSDTTKGKKHIKPLIILVVSVILLTLNIKNVIKADVIILPFPIIIFLIVVLLAHVLLKYTLLGKQIYAIGNNSDNALKAGLNKTRILAVAYISCGILAALGGCICVAQLGNVNVQ